MQTTVTNGEITTVFDVAEFNVNVGESARIDVNEAVNYIKTGQAEVQETVDEGIADFNQNAVEKTNTFNSNATSKTTDFNTNATSKTTAFNDNASSKTTAFNDNYTEKKAVIDSQVELAKDWATKTDGKVDGEDYSAKYYAQSILPIASDITTVSGIASDVTTVSSISSDVTSVASNSADISAVASDLTNIGNVASDLTNIDSVAGNIANVNAVASNATNINAVNSNKTNIDAVAGDLTNINAVAGDLTNINNASTYADNANIWAEGSDAQVQALGGVHSSKGWAEQSAQGQIQSNWAETDTTAKSYIQNKPTLGTMAAESASDYTKTSGLATVATSGSYADLSNKPTIPTVTDTYSATSSDGMSGKAVASAISGKANTDLSNLTSQGQNIANWSSNVSNCITEIPQDIKLELNNGTLTVKAGSKVYVPNGAGVFDTVTVASDISGNYSSITTDYVFFYHTSGALGAGQLTKMNSGTTAPTSPVNGTWWYDTTNNLVKRYNGSSWTQNYSLPICILSTGGSSINQVFNGFGYIGSTVFALPGVKGLIPDGRNDDGSLKNTEFTTSSVLTKTQSWNFDWVICTLYKSNNSIFIAAYGDPDLTFDENKNLFFFNGGVASACPFTKYRMQNRISNFTPKTPFHALDYNDSSTISGWSMPSGRYIDLTLGASGATYTAPANGRVNFVKGANTGEYAVIEILDSSNNVVIKQADASQGGTQCVVLLEIKKGSVYKVSYSASGVTELFRFIYAEGENV